MSEQDSLTQTRGLLLIRSDEGFTCERSTKIGAVFSLSSLISHQEHQGLMKRTQSCLSQRYWHIFFFIYLEWNRIVVVWAKNTSFQSATAEGVLLCTEKDEDFSNSTVKTQIMENPMYNICNISDKQKICHALHPPSLPYAMNSRLQLA